MLRNRLQEENRFQYPLLIGIKFLILASCEIVKNGAYIVSQQIPALVIKEFPQHIDCKQRIIILRAIVINKPLEPLYFIAAIIFYKIKHAALV